MAIWGGFMLVKKTNKAAFREAIILPEAILSARAERMQRHARGGRFRISPPSGLPSFKRPKGCALLDIPVRTGNAAEKLTGGRGKRKGELPDGQSAHPDCHSERSEESVPLVFQEKRQIVTDPSTSLALRSG